MTGQLQTLQGKARISVSLLDAILAQVGVTPIPDYLVEQYKQEQLDEAPASDFVGRFLHRLGIKDYVLDHIIVIGLFVLCFLGIVSAVVGAMALVLFPIFGLTAPSAWSFWALGVGGVGALGAGGLLSATLESRLIFIIGIGPAYWTIVEPKDMGRMPASVHEYIRNIEDRDPDIRFEIADLRQNIYSLDPILYAVKGEDRRAIYIWNGDREVVLQPH